MPHVLISGASIAGPALAYWLTQHGWATTLVERTSTVRDDGQNIDVRGAGREVARRMRVEDAIRAASTGERGTQFVRADGRVVAAFPARASESAGATAELEILRGDLSRIIRERTPETEYLYGDSIASLVDENDGISVTFEHARPRRFDVVVLAEGLHSRTRDLRFPRNAVRELGMYTSYLTMPRSAADNDWWRWYQAGRGRSVTLRPDNVGTIRPGLTFLTDVRGLGELVRADQVMVLRRTFADAGWETPRILEALDDAPFYFEAVGQARLPSWSAGRVALVGDAAYCASPISGMSTSVALVGAYVLAGELASLGDHARAFSRYEQLMRPYVDQAQKLPPGTPQVANPRSRAGVAVLRGALWAAQPLADRLFKPPADKIDLPRY